MSTPIPTYPQPSFYETTRVDIPSHLGSGYYNHIDIEKIVARPKWSQDEAEQRIFKGKVKRGTGKRRRRVRPIRPQVSR